MRGEVGEGVTQGGGEGGRWGSVTQGGGEGGRWGSVTHLML